MQTNKTHPTNPVADNTHNFNWLQLGLPANRSHYTMSLTVDESHMGIIIHHVPNTEYIRWLEILAVAHSDALGYDSQWYKNNKLIWFVRRHEIDYLAEVLTGDKLIMCTWIDSFTKTTAVRKFMVCRYHNDNDNPQIICQAATIWVLVNRDISRPARITDKMANTFLNTQI